MQHYEEENMTSGKLVKGKLTPEEVKQLDTFTERMVESLNKSVSESTKRDERWEMIYRIERSLWPFHLGEYRSRSSVPQHLLGILDECIGISQGIARDACQSEESFEEYCRKH